MQGMVQTLSGQCKGDKDLHGEDSVRLVLNLRAKPKSHRTVHRPILYNAGKVWSGLRTLRFFIVYIKGIRI